MKRLLFLCLLISACGEDSSNDHSQISHPGSTQINAFQEEPFLKEWEKRCVTDNLPLVETNYQNCMLAPGIYGTQGCENNRVENKVRLKNTWELVKSTAQANYRQCMKDIRSYGDHCSGQYDFEISFLVNMKCQAAATWH